MLINLHSPVGCAFLLLCLFLLPYAVSYIYTFQKFCSKNFYNTHYVSANQQMHQRHGFIQKKTHSLGVSSFSQLFMTSSETNSFLMTRHISRLCDTVGGSYADFYYLNFPWDSHSYSTDRVPSMYLLSRYTNPDFGDVVPDVDMGHFFSEILMQGSDGEVLYRQYVVYDEQLIIPVIEDEEIIGLFRVAKKQTNYFSNNVKNEWANDSKQVPLICLNVQILSTLIKSMIKDGNSLQNAEKLELYYHESMTSLQTLRTFAKILRKRLLKNDEIGMELLDNILVQSDSLQSSIASLSESFTAGSNPGSYSPLNLENFPSWGDGKLLSSTKQESTISFEDTDVEQS